MRQLNIICIAVALLSARYAIAENSISASLLEKQFSYTEYADDGTLFNQETGNIPGLGLSLSKSVENYSYGVNVEGYSGLVDYDGQTQSGTPHTTQTNTKMYEIGLFTTTQFFSEHHQLRAGLSRNYWERDILPKGAVLGLYELYHWNTLTLGYEYQKRSGSHQIKFGVDRLWNTNNKMEIDFVGIESTTIPLKKALGWQGSLFYSFDFDHQWQISIQHQWQQWSSDRSDEVLMDSQYGPLLIHEPRSETQSRNLRISISYSL